MALFDKIEVPKSYQCIDTPKKLSWLYEELMTAPYFAYDIESTHATTKSKVRKRSYNKETDVQIAGISYAWGRTKVQTPWQPGKAVYIPLIKMDENPFWGRTQKSVIKVLGEIQGSKTPKIAHNGKFDSRCLYQMLGIKTKNLAFDTMLAHAMLDEERLECSHALKSEIGKAGQIIKLGLADKFLDISASAFKTDLDDALTHYDKDYRRYHKIPLDVLYPYACADADLTLSLMFIFQKMLKAENLDWTFKNISMKLSHAIMLMELHGVPLNIDKARKVEREHKQIMENSAKEVHRLTGQEFDVGSAKQLGKVLFDDLNLPGGIRGKDGWKTGAEVLEVLDHPVRQPLMDYRRAQQIQSTYATPALELMNEITNEGKIGWVHPEIWLDSLTGRLKCRDPNLTNLPRPENGGNIVKGMWEGEDEYYFVFKDFSQMELRVAAHISQEPTWVEGFKLGYDMHAAMAKSVFKLECSVEDVKKYHKDQRSAAKSINFGIIYGETIWSISQDLDIPYEEAEYLVNTQYFGAAPVLKKWIDDTHKFVEENGYVVNMFQRRRHLPDAQIIVPQGVPRPRRNEKPECYNQCVKPRDISVDPQDLYNVSADSLKGLIKSHKRFYFNKCLNCPHLRGCFVNSEVRYLQQTKNRALRQSVNFKVQGSAADMSSLSLIWGTQELMRHKVRSTPILYIHDEIGCYTHKDDIPIVTQIMEECMTTKLQEYTGFSVPLVTDTEIVKCWGDKK
jgi:DNA polymerase I-like protein with 3'-5' exonuclease and polymerase domains